MIALVVMQDAIDPLTAHATDHPMTVLAKHEPSPAARFAARRIMKDDNDTNATCRLRTLVDGVTARWPGGGTSLLAAKRKPQAR
jgi:hypothetical protein